MEIVAWWDDEDRGGYGYDYYIAPANPQDPEHRQLQAEQYRLFLLAWWPYEGDFIH